MFKTMGHHARVWIATFGAGLLAAQAAQAATTINFMTWGGSWQDVFAPVIEKFTKETGIEVNFIAQTGAAAGLNQLTTQRKRPQIDVWGAIESTTATAEVRGLLEPLTAEDVPNLAVIPQRYKTSSSVGVWQTPRGIFYRADKVPFTIEKWQDLWDPRLKDNVGVSFKLDTGSFAIMAALISGGSEKDMGPGFTKIRELKPNIHVEYDTNPDSVRLLTTGEIAVVGWGILPDIYPFLGEDSPYKFVMPAPRFLPFMPFSVVKGRSAEQTAAAKKFINFLLSSEVQNELSETAGVVPTNPDASVAERMKQYIPPMPIQDIYSVDWNVVNKNLQEWGRQWADAVR